MLGNSEGFKRFKRNLITLDDSKINTRSRKKSQKKPKELLEDILEGKEWLLSNRKVPKFQKSLKTIPKTPSANQEYLNLAKVFYYLSGMSAQKENTTQVLRDRDKEGHFIVDSDFASLECLFDCFCITPTKPVRVPDSIKRIPKRKSKPRTGI